MKFNSSKAQVLRISLSKTYPNFPLSFDEPLISFVKNENIIGLNINKKLSWKSHITTVNRDDLNKLRVLIRMQEASSKHLFQLCKNLIRRPMDYILTFRGGGFQLSQGFGQG